MPCLTNGRIRVATGRSLFLMARHPFPVVLDVSTCRTCWAQQTSSMTGLIAMRAVLLGGLRPWHTVMISANTDAVLHGKLQ